MSAKTILIFSVQALLTNIVFSQCTSRAAVDASGYGLYGFGGAGIAGPAIAYDAANWAGRPCDGVYPAPALDFTPTSGGGLPVTSASATPPTGISVVSENAYEGALAVTGELPFVGTAAVEGALPSAGSGAINHACGNGVTAMASENTAFAPAVAPVAAIAPAAAIAPSPIAPTSPITPGLGLGLGANRFGYRGCGGRGYY